MARGQRTARHRHRRGGRARRAVAVACAARLADRDALSWCQTASGSDMLSQHGSRPRVRPRLDIDRPQVPIIDILQGHRHDLRSAVDIDTAEELQTKTGCEILALFRRAALLKHRLRTERIVQFAGSPCPGMKRTRDEFPEWLEVLKHRAD